MSEPPPFLLAENIHKRFGNNEVLKGVTMAAGKHEVISIIGSSGSGKSTFLRPGVTTSWKYPTQAGSLSMEKKFAS